MTDTVHGVDAAQFGGWRWWSPGPHAPARCSYCGSMRPEDLARLLEKHMWRPGPTPQFPEWFWVDIEGRPDRWHCRQACTGTLHAAADGNETTWVHRNNLTEEQIEAVRRGGFGLIFEWYGLTRRAMTHPKFRAVHLFDPGTDPVHRLAIEAMAGYTYHRKPDGTLGWTKLITGDDDHDDRTDAEADAGKLAG